jgi:hypothetical protein
MDKQTNAEILREIQLQYLADIEEILADPENPDNFDELRYTRDRLKDELGID